MSLLETNKAKVKNYPFKKKTMFTHEFCDSEITSEVDNH